MEKDNKTAKKLKSIFWFIIYMMPIFLLLVSILMTMLTVKSSMYPAIEVNVDDLFSAMNSVNSYINTTTLSPILNKFITLIAYGTLEESEEIIIVYISNVLSYYVIIMLIHIIVDFILILPNICKKLFRKGGLDNE